LAKPKISGVRSEGDEKDAGLPHPNAGSHGGSCIIDPTGIVLTEAGIWKEEVVAVKVRKSQNQND